MQSSLGAYSWSDRVRAQRETVSFNLSPIDHQLRFEGKQNSCSRLFVAFTAISRFTPWSRTSLRFKLQCRPQGVTEFCSLWGVMQFWTASGYTFSSNRKLHFIWGYNNWNYIRKGGTDPVFTEGYDLEVKKYHCSKISLIITQPAHYGIMEIDITYIQKLLC